MKFNRPVFLLVFLSAGAAPAYGGSVHNRLAREALTFVKNNKGEAAQLFSGYEDIVADGAQDPDRVELSNAEIQQNSDLKNYNFEKAVAANMGAAVDVLFRDTNPFAPFGTGVALNASVFGASRLDTTVALLMKGVIAQTDGESSLAEFKRATQHTFVKGEGMFGETFNDISIAPYSAQADYGLALKAWNVGNKSEAMRRLGRVLHYVQDITVPHHSSLDVNIPDVARATVEFVKVGGQNIKTNSSQYRFETTAATQYLDSTFKQSSLDRAQLTSNSSLGRPIPEVVIGIRDRVRASGMMGKVDGYSNGGLAKKGFSAWVSKLWSQIREGVKDFTGDVKDALTKLKDDLVHGARDKAGSALQQVVEEHLNSTYLYRSSNDDFSGAAATLVPLAIVESAKILDRFTYEVGSGAGSCTGAADGWSACRGSGCSVCTDKLDTQKYDLYFKNHPNCKSNNSCKGKFYSCSSNCPAPTPADSSGQPWSGCRGTDLHVCTEKTAAYSKYFQNHPSCKPNATCGGRFYRCSASCPAPSDADR